MLSPHHTYSTTALGATNPELIRNSDLITTLIEVKDEYISQCETLTKKYKDLKNCHNDIDLKKIRVSPWTVAEYLNMKSRILDQIRHRSMYLLIGKTGVGFYQKQKLHRDIFEQKDYAPLCSLDALGYKSVEHVFDVHYTPYLTIGDLISEYITPLIDEYQGRALKSGDPYRKLISRFSIDLKYLLRQSNMILKEIQRY